VQIDAVDLAAIAPEWPAQLAPALRERLHFHPATAVERLPLADASIDLAISQFGLEYTALPAALAELHRVLKPTGGRIALIVHASESLIVRQARTELDHVRWAQKSTLLEHAAAMCAPMSRLTSAAGREALRKDTEANALRARFNQSMQALATRAEAADCPDLLFELLQAIAAAMEACARSGDAAAGRETIAHLGQGLHDNAGRLSELVTCAQDRAQAEVMLAPIGVELESCEPVRFAGGELLGWGLQGRL
jgi:SAM-dependent methyltransferase